MTHSELWGYLNQEYGLTPTQDEIHEILQLARQEIELPDDEEMKKAAMEYARYENMFGIFIDEVKAKAFFAGAKWALNKVRNPKPL